MKIRNVVFMGTPMFCIPSLEALRLSKHNVCLVMTQPDQGVGRGQKIVFSPVKQYAIENNLKTIQPRSLQDPKLLEEIRELKPDIGVVAAYGRILPMALIQVFPHLINVHASLLPRWRGASPIAQAILHGDEQTGISIMQIVPALDAGPVMLQKSMDIDAQDDVATLTQRLSKLGAKALLEALYQFETGRVTWTNQDEKKITFAPLMDASSAKINWNKSASTVHNHIRGFGPEPGAYTMDGLERIKIFQTRIDAQDLALSPGQLLRTKKQLWVGCGEGQLEILMVQRPGKKKQSILDFLNGYSKEHVQW